ncbi:type II toxin-antitoxin system HicB family antitoxin [Plasticicumulans sp.]|uniref:type II toxin-antitoxin system HicB family antitoxin n=1 Tax=Plasticicumulans sp. TaxID=2307179 RepID=UPI002C15CBF6|nr:type II toxin-antitoxin system HicB family antitoxin [Plasticicumulans sp.]HMV40413.1 type II toxin-antitoxin system HicB family antitoxin [Plasticicumulans sp.]HMW31060.1 type II toxin-antitoxin system HicB family antitoxin [Plasticicumulans sp.]HND99653.1 type II toxin-antitoxin system HicB family antitoxin [Plasticicumulans sp.]HNE02473.1 type II toxin-antitoxin system HicB family antitoxin [Plasticicumulans sp.]HNF67119.1 type II toxin-antitoxin system HicB family antitoxin [Plasticicum
MLAYALNVVPDTVGFMSTCRDLPEFVGVGDSIEDALRLAVEGLETTIGIYIDERRPVPMPSAPEPGEHAVYVPALTAAKALLSNAMIETGWRKADLVRALGVHPPQVDRLLDVNHHSKLDQIEAALLALGRRLVVEVQRAA